MAEPPDQTATGPPDQVTHIYVRKTGLDQSELRRTAIPRRRPMSRRIRTTTAALTSVATVAATALVLSGGAAASPAAAAGCGVLFDDFHYSAPTDSAFGGAGWTTRND